MLQTIYRPIYRFLVIGLVLSSGVTAATASDQAKNGAASRSPASIPGVSGIPGLAGFQNHFRVPMITLPRKPEGNVRWRLLGTCRNDIGMQQSVSGLGYGNCLKN